MEGNERWVSGALHRPDRDPDRRQLLAQDQEPFGAILSCIDSRVPPELLFDTGLGDLYGKPLPGNLQSIVKALQPAYKQAVKEGGADPVETMARAQVKLTATDLRSNQDLAPLVGKGRPCRGGRLLLARHRQDRSPGRRPFLNRSYETAISEALGGFGL